MKANLEYYKGLAHTVVNAADCLQYDNACTLLILSLDYGEFNEAPQCLQKLWHTASWYRNMVAAHKKEGAEFESALDKAFQHFNDDVNGVKTWLGVGEKNG